MVVTNISLDGIVSQNFVYSFLSGPEPVDIQNQNSWFINESCDLHWFIFDPTFLTFVVFI